MTGPVIPKYPTIVYSWSVKKGKMIGPDLRWYTDSDPVYEETRDACYFFWP